VSWWRKGKACHFRKILPLKIGFTRAQTSDYVCIAAFYVQMKFFNILHYFKCIRSFMDQGAGILQATHIFFKGWHA
jgi:hypothetical protein